MGLTLYDYQMRGIEFLKNRNRCLLADDMGVGKTPQAIVASELIGARRIVVICPAIMCQTWAAEYMRWCTHPPRIKVIRSGKDTVPSDGVAIVSYDLAVRRPIFEQLTQSWRDLLILDESHFLKEKESQRTQAVLGKELTGRGGIAGRAHRVWCLTGTPAPNHVGELYPMLRFLGVWKDGYGRFLTEFTIFKDHPKFGIRVTGVKKPDTLRQMLSPVMLRRTKAQVLKDLPPIAISEVFIEPAECDALRQLREEEPYVADRIKRAIDTDDWTFDGDEQVARVRRLVGMAKVTGVSQLIKYEIACSVSKMVVFGLHTDFLACLHNSLPSSGLIYGATPGSERQRLIKAFQKEKLPRVLVLQTRIASTGLTLTAADNVLIGEASWTPSDNAQAMMRVHRIGQKRRVLARFATLAGTIDEAVTAALRRKSAAIAAFLS